jgi:hypothetical protein
MSFIGGPIEASLAQLAQAQRSAAEGRDREKASSESARRASDSVTLKVAGLEDVSAVRRNENDDLEEREERENAPGKDSRREGRQDEHAGDDGDPPPPTIDIRA